MRVSKLPGSSKAGFGMLALGLAAATALVVTVGVLADRSGPADSPPAPVVAASGPLDGLAFAGTFGPAGEPADLTDTLYFADGRFWSENCVPCGFAPGIYWVRYGDEGTHFRGRLQSPQSGRFTYEGVVRDDGRIVVDINWRKDRWYWSIDRDFRFVGEAAEPETAARAAAQAARAALDARADRTVTCDPRR